MNEHYSNGVLYRFVILRVAFTLITFLLMNSLVLSSFPDFGSTDFQQRTIRGIVTDETGAPFPYVNVYLDGNVTVGVTTNDKGEYRITVPDNSTLVFAFVGYRSMKVPVGTTDVLDVKMEPEMKAIDEVVVVGYGEQRRASVTSAVATIKSDQIVQTPVSSVTQALAGRLPGLTTMQSSGEPGADHAEFYVRGVGTWNDALPLYVIDGVERSSTIFRTMSPEEIESVSILKDAAATAVYGSKGANGVILVTTKRGTQGAPEISFSSSYTIQQFTRFPQYLDSYNSLVLYNEALMNDGGDPAYSEQELELYRNGSDPYRYPNVDWYKEMMKSYAPQFNSSFSIRGGSRTVSYFVSASYMNQGGHLEAKETRVYDADYNNKRYRFTSNLDAFITKAFTLSFELGATYNDKTDPYADDVFSNMNRLGSWRMPALNPNGSFSGTSEFPNMNPIYLINGKGTDNRLTKSLTSAIKMNFNLGSFIKGLTFNARVAYDSNFGNNQYWTETPNTYELISRAGRADRYKEYLQRVYFGSSTGTASPTRTFDGLASLQYSRKFGDHGINLQALSTINERLYSSQIPFHSVSFVGRANYSFKSRYNIEGNAAYRGSENFAPGNRFGFFPSISASWNVHDESFMNSISFLNLLKVRTSYGLTGSDYVNTRFLYKEGKWTSLDEGTNSQPAAYFGPGAGNTRGISVEPSIANPLATWETAHQYNFGIDLAVLDDKISASFDRFFEKRDGILQTSNSFSGILGIGVPELNIGKTSRNGWEFELAFNQKIGADFNISIRPNISYFENKVIFRDEPEDMDWWLKEEGFPIDQPRGYVVLGYFKDQEDIANSPVQQVGTAPIPGDFKYLDFNGDGVVNQFDIVPISYTAVPNYTLGTTFSFSYKSVDLSLHFQGGTQSSIYLSQYLQWEFYNRAPVMEHHLGRWTPETHETATYPVLHMGSVSQNHVPNTFWRKDNTYLRLKTLNIGYSLSPSIARKLGLKGMGLSFSGINLITWDKLKTLDPETSTGTQTQVYPQSKNYTLRVNINF
ncbi:MAG: TonB-dependent receptor [Bacteroidales bacterium]|nr:TonB-dependent receptor [Bacteroidales bacterium]